MVTIDILVPVLGRPDNAQPLVDSITANTKLPHTIVFLPSWDDDEERAACLATGATVVPVGDDGYAAKINEGVRRSSADYVFLGADDLRFHPKWDKNAVAVHRSTGKPVVGTNDLGNPAVIAGRHATHSLVHRSYRGTIDEPELLVHEGYSHNWVDTEFCETAMHRDAFAFAFDSIVEHLHPFWGKSPDDVIYERGREGYHHDRRHFQRRRKLWKGRGR